MAKIKKVTKITTINGDRCGRYGYWVYYTDTYARHRCHIYIAKHGRKRYYGMNENLPVTIVNFLLEAECTQTNEETWGGETLKYETFEMNADSPKFKIQYTDDQGRQEVTYKTLKEFHEAEEELLKGKSIDELQLETEFYDIDKEEWI